MIADIKRVLTEMVKLLVDHPEDVKIDVVETTWTIVCTIHVDENDKGKVIGRRGQTMKSIARVLTAACRRTEKRSVQVGLADLS